MFRHKNDGGVWEEVKGVFKGGKPLMHPVPKPGNKIVWLHDSYGGPSEPYEVTGNKGKVDDQTTTS